MEGTPKMKSTPKMRDTPKGLESMMEGTPNMKRDTQKSARWKTLQNWFGNIKDFDKKVGRLRVGEFVRKAFLYVKGRVGEVDLRPVKENARKQNKKNEGIYFTASEMKGTPKMRRDTPKRLESTMEGTPKMKIDTPKEHTLEGTPNMEPKERIR